MAQIIFDRTPRLSECIFPSLNGNAAYVGHKKAKRQFANACNVAFAQKLGVEKASRNEAADDATPPFRARWRHNPTGQETEKSIRNVFVFIGAAPETRWLKDPRVFAR